MENPIQGPPPGTHAATDPHLAAGYSHGQGDGDVDLTIDRAQYKAETPLWKRIRQHSLTQMLFISVQAFCGPALSDAISGLGGGGLATPKTSNIRFALDQGVEAIVCLFGAVLVNFIGVKWSLVIGAASFPLLGASYYCNSQFNNQWFLIATAPFTGTGFGFWNIAEGAYVMSIAPEAKRGKYLALWIVSRNAGQLVGGAINLAKNAEKNSGGGIDPSTYIPFIVLEALALPFAFGICEMKDVEMRYIVKTYLSKIIYCSFIFIIWSYFYNGPWSTYLALYFSVRARALSSLICPFFCIIGCFGLGYVTDLKGYSQRRRAQFGFWLIIVLNVAVYVWSLIMQVRFVRNDPGPIDWSDKRFSEAFLPYFFIQTTGPLAQVYTYWILSSFAESGQDNVRFSAALKAIQCVGNAIAFGVSAADSSPLTGMILNCALMVACIPGMWYITNKTPDRIPADVIAEEMALEAEQRKKMEDPDKKDALEEVHTREVATLA
ncbi:uncharacterized protein I303_100856 [Kwoniella dejecticola CBS 10117]|uniref:MFS general substrate transporter n=1 Tax=Kwoniella dejecticola CBS 10117 TaxID=1296121 RepID=A0A1A6AG31_9TREE|nr:uncharacterized protein I303_00859 [Kwoniella dejecticola CBS 10117]OBR89037.1 hypothetical protein I303_00859 [Kwoniella dejecticola CBS 10117]